MTNQALTQTTVAHVVTIELSGMLTVEDVRDFTRRINAALKQHDRIGIVVDVTQWSDMTADAITADVKAEFAMLPKLRRIPRIAILSNKQWYNAVVGWFSPMLFTTDVKVFDPSRAAAKQEAIAFASDIDGTANAPKQEPSIVLIPTDRDDLVAFEYHGHIRSEDLDVALVPLKERMDRNDQIDLLVRMDHFSGFDPSIMFKGGLLSLKMAALKKLRRYAIVGASDWMSGMAKMFDPLVGIEMKTFDVDQEDEAWTWISQSNGPSKTVST
ncbi:SpoIIAA family protein [Rhodopirellula bahusiensis]|uniref:STAS/SEC14 domain-containing protein n=1 Tax=Rhodopirellula bahusiensis TaxID=2014065 RepID=A0A2G1W780_9BACT|nr:STAS/SEC14 domain-containing protein [Rhodopirellula bahusiensis]PHQ34892.1 hypothetical protein CEE69_13600 [Rhodopirellula bahusiensis]